MRPLLLLILFVLLPACASSPALTDTPVASRSLASSREGRPLPACTLGSGARRIYVIASIHGDEPEGRSAIDELQHHFASSSNQATVRLVADMNPDGSGQKSRTNASGVDLNRNWPASNFKAARAHGKAPLSEPETAAVHADITAFDPHVIVVLHSARGGPFINYDGPAAAGALADCFAAAARGSGDTRWRTVPDMGYSTPGSMGSYFGKDRKLPILTVEFRRGDPEGKIPAPLIAGLNAIAGDRSIALLALSQASPKRLARR